MTSLGGGGDPLMVTAPLLDPLIDTASGSLASSTVATTQVAIPIFAPVKTDIDRKKVELTGRIQYLSSSIDTHTATIGNWKNSISAACSAVKSTFSRRSDKRSLAKAQQEKQRFNTAKNELTQLIDAMSSEGLILSAGGKPIIDYSKHEQLKTMLETKYPDLHATVREFPSLLGIFRSLTLHLSIHNTFNKLIGIDKNHPNHMGKGSFGVVVKLEPGSIGASTKNISKVAAVALKIPVPNRFGTIDSADAQNEVALSQHLNPHGTTIGLQQPLRATTFSYKGQKVTVTRSPVYTDGDLKGNLGTLTPKQKRQAFYQLSQGLKHLHAQGVLHGDLKPANVLVDIKKGLYHIADLGGARKADELKSKLSRLRKDYSIEKDKNYKKMENINRLITLGKDIQNKAFGIRSPMFYTSIDERILDTLCLDLDNTKSLEYIEEHLQKMDVFAHARTLYELAIPTTTVLEIPPDKIYYIFSFQSIESKRYSRSLKKTFSDAEIDMLGRALGPIEKRPSAKDFAAVFSQDMPKR